MKINNYSKVVSLLLTMTLLSITNSNAFAVGTTTNDDFGDIAQTDENFALPDIVTSAEAEEYGFVSRDYDAEPNLNTFIFNNADGSNTMKVYAHPVKYEDKDGKIKDITLNLNQNRDGSFTTADNNIITTLPNELSQGISLTYEDIHLRMIPETGKDSITAKYDERTRQVTYQADEQTSYVYGLTYAGFKEDIVVTEYTGQTDYCFTLYTDGLALTNKEGTFFLTDREGETTANLSDIIVYTADDRNNTFGSITYRTVKENEQYDLIIHLDEEFLRSDATAYPIRIDPSIVVNSSSGIIDSTICSLYNASMSSSNSLTVGNMGNNYGRARVLMKFPGIDYELFRSSANISKATLELTDLSRQFNTITVDCFQFDGNTWGTSPIWSNVIPYKWSTNLSFNDVSYYEGLEQTTPHRYVFDITTAVKRWKDTSFNKDQGIMLKTANSIETSGNNSHVNFASVEHSTDGPALTIKYILSVRRNEFYSRYNKEKFNSFFDFGAYVNTAWIKSRMNCYGYAFGFLLNEQVLYPGSYKQQPGEFASIPLATQSLSTSSSNEDFLDRIEHNMELDANRIGYTITRYYPSSSITEIPQYGKIYDNSRLIAVVAKQGVDYHFYMQHSDGTWSHKPGADNTSNTSITDNYVLTNDNIQSKAKQGNYSEGALRFYLITKKPTVDFPHSNRQYEPGEVNPLFPMNYPPTTIYDTYDKAGDYLDTAVSISNAQAYDKDAIIDFNRDEDYYYYNCTTTDLYNISIEATNYNGNTASLMCIVYNTDGNTVASSGYGTVNLNVSLSAGHQYYIYVRTGWINNALNDTSSPIQYNIKVRSSD